MEDHERFDEKMKNMFFNFNEYCASKNYKNIDFLDGLLNSICILYNEQKDDKERTHFKNHVFKMLFECFGLIEKFYEAKEDK